MHFSAYYAILGDWAVHPLANGSRWMTMNTPFLGRDMADERPKMARDVSIRQISTSLGLHIGQRQRQR